MVDHTPLMTAESLVDEDGSVIVRDDLEELLKVTLGWYDLTEGGSWGAVVGLHLCPCISLLSACLIAIPRSIHPLQT